MKPNFENRFFAAAFFAGMLIFVIMIFSCCESEPAERVIRSQTAGILKFKPEWQHLEDNIVLQLDSSGKVINYTNADDNRWYRPNGFTYSEQISWAKPYFTDLFLKYDFDYIRIYGCKVPLDTLAAHIIADDSVLIAQYVTIERSGGEQFTVELFDAWIQSGEFAKYVVKYK